MVKCYLCDKDSDGKYCFYCNRPICDDHAQWKGRSRFAYCPLDDSKFYKPFYDFLKDLEDYAKKKKIAKKYLVKSVIDKVIDVL